MTRASIKLRFAAALLVCAALAGCSSDDGSGDDPDKEDPSIKDTLGFTFSPIYSAFDGTHTYQVPALLDQAVFDTAAVDYIDPATVKWEVDKAFATAEEWNEYPGAVLLTTKKAGTTNVIATATTKSGQKVRGRVELKITAAKADEWDQGEARYNNMRTFDLSMLRPPAGGLMGGMMFDIASIIPRDTSCAMCHNNNGGATALTVEHTPLQTGGYSDEELIQIFTTGAKPMGAGFNSPILKNLPATFATTIYTALHTWEIAPEVQRGIVYKLRSITPKKQEEIDLTRIRMMFGMGMGMGMGAGAGAAGAAAPTP
jgi:hypothetical protein